MAFSLLNETYVSLNSSNLTMDLLQFGQSLAANYL